MYRFRTGDNGELVLQVFAECPETAGEHFGRAYTYREAVAKWRDATIADIPVQDPFWREPRVSGETYGVGGTD